MEKLKGQLGIICGWADFSNQEYSEYEEKVFKQMTILSCP
jgi:hypothetical protein